MSDRSHTKTDRFQLTRQEWTYATGFRRAVTHLVIWSCVSAAIWIAAIYSAAPLFDRFRARIFLIPSALLGALIGWLLVRRLSEVAGFSSWLLTFLAVCGATTVTVGGIIIVGRMLKISDMMMFGVAGPACLGALATILLMTLNDG